MKQKFQEGDVVQIAKKLGESMSHFPSGILAVVVGSYYDQYSWAEEKDKKEYTLFLLGRRARGETSWYDEHQLKKVGKITLEALRILQKEDKR